MARFAMYEKVFTPSAPIRSRPFLVGRAQEFTDLESDLRRPGVHPLVMGARGVGKTSLVHLAIEGAARITLSCGRDVTFADLARSILLAFGYGVPPHSHDGVPDHSAIPITETHGVTTLVAEGKSLAGRKLNAWTVFEALREHGSRVIIVLDEYDLVPHTATAFHAEVAELIKYLSDNSEQCDSRLVIVGVARSAEALLGRHESIERSGDEVYLRPLRNKDVEDFLTRAERHAKFLFAPEVKHAIVMEANGYPYYVHLMGLLAVEEMVKRDSNARVVTDADFVAAQKRAWNKAIRAALGKHRTTLMNLTVDEKKFLRAVVTDRHSTVKRKVLENALMTRAGWNAEHCSYVLETLVGDKKLVYWSRGKDLVRFNDPLLPLFLRSWWFPQLAEPVDALLSDEQQLDLFPDEDEV